MEILSRAHAKNLVKWAADKPNVLLLSADLTSSCESELFRDAYPDRFLSMGIAEQNMHSFAGGLAREGFFPFIHTFAVFIYRRSYDQIAMSIAYPNLPVRMFGFLPGVTTPGGASHQALEDIAIMRSLPNMTVLETGDATEVESVLDVAHQVNGPVYVRMIRGEVPRLFDKNQAMTFGRARRLREGNDIVLISSGICTEEALRATAVLTIRGVSVSHLHISTLKPFNDPQVIAAIEKTKYGVITMENHSTLGGLGSCVAQAMLEHNVAKKLLKIGIQDTFMHGASKNYLMQEYRIDAQALIAQVEKLIGEELHIGSEELSEVRLEPVQSNARAEAL
jgi:transketolase